jgi:hypothetical protein
MQIFIHDLVGAGPLRDTDAEMQQTASDAAQLLTGLTGLTFSGVRMFIERTDGQDAGLIVIEDAHYNGKEFPTGAEMDQLEADLRSGIESDPGVVSVGSVRFHCLTNLTT